jgi:hypothetical protein
MFHFLRFPPLRATRVRLVGFPHSDIAGLLRLHTPRPGFSQCTTSFIGTRRQGIPRMLFFALAYYNIAVHNQALHLQLIPAIQGGRRSYIVCC